MFCLGRRGGDQAIEIVLSRYRKKTLAVSLSPPMSLSLSLGDRPLSPQTLSLSDCRFLYLGDCLCLPPTVAPLSHPDSRFLSLPTLALSDPLSPDSSSLSSTLSLRTLARSLRPSLSVMAPVAGDNGLQPLAVGSSDPRGVDEAVTVLSAMSWKKRRRQKPFLLAFLPSFRISLSLSLFLARPKHSLPLSDDLGMLGNPRNNVQSFLSFLFFLDSF